MNKQEIIETIKTEKAFLQTQFGVEEIGLFGSFARGEENEKSDVDILVRLKTPSYSLLMGLYGHLKQKLNINIDIVRQGPHLSERFLKMIKKDLINV